VSLCSCLELKELARMVQGVIGFEPRSEQLTNFLRLPRSSLVYPGKFNNSAIYRAQPFPSRPFPLYHARVIQPSNTMSAAFKRGCRVQSQVRYTVFVVPLRRFSPSISISLTKCHPTSCSTFNDHQQPRLHPDNIMPESCMLHC
jgi:hypothetical protein